MFLSRSILLLFRIKYQIWCSMKNLIMYFFFCKFWKAPYFDTLFNFLSWVDFSPLKKSNQFDIEAHIGSTWKHLMQVSKWAIQKIAISIHGSIFGSQIGVGSKKCYDNRNHPTTKINLELLFNFSIQISFPVLMGKMLNSWSNQGQIKNRTRYSKSVNKKINKYLNKISKSNN